MSRERIRKDIQKLQRTLKNAPRILEFRGRRVVRAYEWKWMDWSTLPDGFNLLVIMNDKEGFPEDWLRDYADLLWKLEDREFGKMICMDCIINLAQDAKREIDRFSDYWRMNLGEPAKQKHLEEIGERSRLSYLKEDAMHEVHYRLYKDVAEDRTCGVINYFKCPYGEQRNSLTKDGSIVHEIWQHIEWYHRHWNRDPTIKHPASEMKWYHFNEPPILDVTSFEDVLKALDDGRFNKITEEHERYMKETGAKIWNT